MKLSIATNEPEVAERFFKYIYKEAPITTSELAAPKVDLVLETRTFVLAERKIHTHLSDNCEQANIVVDYGAECVGNAAIDAIKTGFAAAYGASELLAALREFWTTAKPDAKNPLREVFIRELRRRWLDLAKVEGFFEYLGVKCDALSNHIVVFASEDNYDDEGRLLGPEWECPYCGMEIAWPGSAETCPACLHMASLGNSNSPWFRYLEP